MNEVREHEFLGHYLEHSPLIYFMSNREKKIEVQGKILESLPNTTFKVETDDGRIILCYISGRMRLNFIKIIPGDKVIVEQGPYDSSRGRITRRL